MFHFFKVFVRPSKNVAENNNDRPPKKNYDRSSDINNKKVKYDVETLFELLSYEPILKESYTTKVPENIINTIEKIQFRYYMNTDDDDEDDRPVAEIGKLYFTDDLKIVWISDEANTPTGFSFSFDYIRQLKKTFGDQMDTIVSSPSHSSEEIKITWTNPYGRSIDPLYEKFETIMNK